MVAVTSGTIGQTQYNTRLVVDHAFRACRLAPQQITSEYIRVATEQLGLMLSAWANTSTPLWCQTKVILPMVQGVYQLNVANTFPGTVDILEANLRWGNQFTGSYTASSGVAANAFDHNPQTACAQTAPGGNITMQLTAASAVENVGIMPAVSGQSWTVSFQYSNDGVAWTTFDTQTIETVAGTFVWFDYQGLPTATYWRVQAAPTTTLNVAELYYGNMAIEIPVARINKDDYWNLPNKTFQGRPVQYWCDRQVAGPVMWLWPCPGAAFVFQQITVLVHRHIMDVGQLYNVLELPQRAFDAVTWSLGERLRMVIPEVDKQMTADLPAQAKEARMRFWAEERDNSPIFLQLDTSPYTA